MTVTIGRRKLLAALGGAAAAWPLAARGQQRAMPVIGFLGSGSAVPPMTGLRKGLSEAGYVDGQNVTIEYRWAEGQYDRLPALAAGFASRPVAVMVAAGIPAALACKTATTNIPVVFLIGEDPVRYGLVASLNRPAGNLTGVNFFVAELGAKQLGLLHELVPAAGRVGLLVNPNSPVTEAMIKEVTAAAAAIGFAVDVVPASDSREIEAAFATLVRNKVGALLVGADALFISRRVQIATLAARHIVPAAYPQRDFTEAGGLMSYGSNVSDAYRQVGVYAGRIVKGEKPADLPVVQSAKFELVINLPTARALGLEVPPMLLARADEVIE
jgi:putative ABC transport system substrate-binding protein